MPQSAISQGCCGQLIDIKRDMLEMHNAVFNEQQRHRDTLTARCDQQTVKIRLAETDAPEKAQPLQRGHLSEVKYLSFVGRQGVNHEAN